MAFQLTELLGYLINRSSTLMRAELQDRFKQEGLLASGVDWAILGLLLSQDGLSLSEIAAKTTKDKTTITRQLEKLEKRHFITRIKDTEDLRVSYIHLTDKGRAFVHQLIPIVQDLASYLTADVSKSDLEATKRCLKKIMKKLGNEALPK